jgi:zinc protease
MGMRGVRLLAMAMALTSPSFAAPASAEPTWPPPAPITTTLENGLRVIIAEDHRLPLVGMELRYDVGGRSDPSGIALIVPPAIIYESKHVPRGAYERNLLDAGASNIRWVVGMDATAFRLTLPASRANLVLWLWSDQMGFAEQIGSEAISGPRGTLDQGRARRVDDVAYGALEGLVRKHLYPDGHPYVNAQIGGLAPGAEASAATLRAFFLRWYGPENATLAIAGDVNPPQLVAEITKYFGPIPRRSAPAVVAPAEGPPTNVRLDVAANVAQGEVAVDWLVPGGSRPDHALEVLAEALSGRTSVLVWELVDKRKLATATSASYSHRELGSTFEVRVDIAKGHTPDEVLAALDSILTSELEGLVNAVVVQRAAASLGIDSRRDLEGMLGRAHFLTGQPRGQPIEAIAMNGSYDWIHADEVIRAARKHLTGARRRVITVFTPDPSAPIAGTLRAKRDLGRNP